MMNAIKRSPVDKMARINGTDHPELAAALSRVDCTICRAYNVHTGRSDKMWTVSNHGMVVVYLIRDSVVQRWVRSGLAEIDHGCRIEGYDTCHEYCCLNRCCRCSGVGTPIDDDWLCPECAAIRKAEGE